MNHNRPHIICHMMSTIDGKITSGTGADILEDYFSLYTKIEDKLEAKAWMIGRVTMEMFAESVGTPLPESCRELDAIDMTYDEQHTHHMFAVDTKGMLRWKGNTITLSNVKNPLHLVVLVTKKTPRNYLGYLAEKKISFIVAGDDELDFAAALSKMKNQFGVEKLLLEGGGKLNGSMMAAGMIDEISLVLTPRVINRTQAPSLFERTTEEITLTDFKLVSVEKVEQDAVWLRYRRANSK